MSVSKRLRFEVLRRDGHACRYCGATAPDVKLHVDHVIPVSLGGTDDPENLVAACVDCNAGKSSSSPDAATVAEVAEAQAEHRRHLESVKDAAADEHRALEVFLETWDRFRNDDDEQEPLPRGWRRAIRSYLDVLVAEDLEELVYVAMDKALPSDARFRYFCGCCRRRKAERLGEPEPPPYEPPPPDPLALAISEAIDGLERRYGVDVVSDAVRSFGDYRWGDVDAFVADLEALLDPMVEAG